MVHKQYFSTLTAKRINNNKPSPHRLSPEWVKGLKHAEGCFHLGIIKRASSPIG